MPELWWSARLQDAVTVEFWESLAESRIHGVRLIAKAVNPTEAADVVAVAAKLAQTVGVRAAVDLPGVRPMIGDVGRVAHLETGDLLQYRSGHPTDGAPSLWHLDSAALVPGRVFTACDGALRLEVERGDTLADWALRVVSGVPLEGVRSLGAVLGSVLADRSAPDDIRFAGLISERRADVDLWVSNCDSALLAEFRMASPHATVVPKIERKLPKEELVELAQDTPYGLVGRADLTRAVGTPCAALCEAQIVTEYRKAGARLVFGSGMDACGSPVANWQLDAELSVSYVFAYDLPQFDILLTDICRELAPREVRRNFDERVRLWTSMTGSGADPQR